MHAQIRSVLAAVLGMLSLACGSKSGLLLAEDGVRDDAGSPLDAGRLGEPIVACGDYHTCAARRGGRAYCWGAGSQGQLGNGANTGVPSPVAVTGLDGVLELAAGWWHSCAVQAGRVVCWGSNGSGQLGTGTTNDEPTPAVVTSISGAIKVCTGMTHSCALERDGRVACWGSNLYGEVGAPAGLDSRLVPEVLPEVSSAIDIACGNHHSCAVERSGRVICWGKNSGLQAGPGPDPQPPIEAPTIDDAVEVAAGFNYTCVRRRSDAVDCWGGVQSKLVIGWPPREILGPGSARALDARGTAMCAVTADGVVCWGFSSQIVNAVSPGTLVPAPVAASGAAVQVAVGGGVGENHACIVLGGDALVCWGRNSEGQVGDGSVEPRDAPVAVALP